MKEFATESDDVLLTGGVADGISDPLGKVADSLDDLVGVALVTARQIAENGPLAVWMTKETMWQTVDSPSLRHALDLENRTQVMCTATG